MELRFSTIHRPSVTIDNKTAGTYNAIELNLFTVDIYMIDRLNDPLRKLRGEDERGRPIIESRIWEICSKGSKSRVANMQIVCFRRSLARMLYVFWGNGFHADRPTAKEC